MTAAESTEAGNLGSVLVVGGCGFLGSHIVSLLLERYSSPAVRLSVLDIDTSRNTYPGVAYYQGDITSAEAVRNVLETKPNIVIHTASPVSSSVYGAKARQQQEAFFRKVNVAGTQILMEEAKKAGITMFVYTSSTGVISDGRTNMLNADERYDYLRQPLQQEYYLDTKAEAEALVLSYNTRPSACNPNPFLTTAIRPSAMFGERDIQIVPPMLKVLKKGQSRFQLGDNDNIFDFTYVGNTAQAHVLAATKLLELSRSLQTGGTALPPEETEQDAADEDKARVDGRAIIITNNSPVYFWDFTRAIWAAYSRTPPSSSSSRTSIPTYKDSSPIVLPLGLALFMAYSAAFIFSTLRLRPPKLNPSTVRYSCMTRYFNTRRAQVALGYQPVWSLIEGIERTVQWYKEREGLEVTTGVKKSHTRYEHYGFPFPFLGYVRNDLANTTAPPYFIAPFSGLELASCWTERPTIFTAPAFEPDPAKRLLSILKLVLVSLKCQFYVGGATNASIKKPFNAFLGELFIGSWSDASSTVNLVAEQVSHHPPVAALYVWNEEHGITMQGYIHVELSFSGSVKIRQTGHYVSRIERYNEDILIRVFSGEMEGLLSERMYPELYGRYYIVSSTGFMAELRFSGAGFFRGERNSFEAVVYHRDDVAKSPLYKVSGQWSGSFDIADVTTGEIMETYDTNSESNSPTDINILELQSQDPWESRRAWQHVKTALEARQYGVVVDEKSKIEKAQRQMRVLEKQRGEVWKPLLFDVVKGEYELFTRLGPAAGIELSREKTKGVWKVDAEKAKAIRSQQPFRGELTPLG